MSDFELWSRGGLADEGRRQRIPRKREAWQVKGDAVFRAAWGERSSRSFPSNPRDQLPVVNPTRRKPGNRLGLILLAVFAVGLVLGWLAR